MSTEVIHVHWSSPVGPLDGIIGPRGLIRLMFGWKDGAANSTGEFTRERLESEDGAPMTTEMLGSQQRAALELTETWLGDYLAGKNPKRRPQLDWPGVPDFHRKVYEWLLGLPWGQTVSYGAVAQAVGSSGAARAVGQAMNKNPIVLIVPCHRVLAAGGKLGGFGSGLDLKQKLLAHEANGNFFR